MTWTKKVVEHSPTNAYLLNMHALYNYQWILAVLPPDLYTWLKAAVVTDHDSLCLHAAKLICASTPTEGESILANSTLNSLEQPALAFVKATKLGTRKVSKAMKTKGKGKAKPSGATPKAAAAASTSNHHTLTALPASSSSLITLSIWPVLASFIPVTSSALTPVLESFIPASSHGISHPLPPQYSIAYPTPAHCYLYVSVPSHYTMLPLHPHTPISLHALPAQGLGSYWVRPTGPHQPTYVPITSGVHDTAQPESDGFHMP